MSKFRTFQLLVLSLSFSIVFAMGESLPPIEKVPLPPGPLLKRVADFSAWKITYYYPRNAENTKELTDGIDPGMSLLPNVPKRITLTRTKPLWRAEIEDVNGNILDQCWDGNVEMIVAPGSSTAGLAPSAFMGGRSTVNFAQVDFPDFEWISDKTFVGLQPQRGRSCMVFVKDDMTAWVDLESRMPVFWQKGTQTRTYEKLATPTSPLTLPAPAAALSEALKKDQERLMRKPPKGG